MNNALATHRVDYDQVPVKSLVQCKNSILEKRKLKKVVTGEKNASDVVMCD